MFDVCNGIPVSDLERTGIKATPKELENKIISPNDTSSLQKTADLVFHAGFSTATQVTEVSGRGVGMDAVKKFLIKYQGNVEVNLLGVELDERGCIPFEFLITLPATLAVRK